MKRTAFFISDSTGITAETLGQSLLAQFDDLTIDKRTLPYIDSEAKARDAVLKINAAAQADGAAPIVFDTLVNQQVRSIIAQSEGFLFDIFATFLAPLEQALQLKSNYTVGRGHLQADDKHYKNRIDALHYALQHDDGSSLNYDDAELILVGVSRCGKTPTSLYLAMQAGVFTANYPLTEDDLEQMKLPRALLPHKERLFGLTINPDRLAAIRDERRSGSRYASIQRCEDDVRLAEGLFERYQIPYVDTTEISIEEIATKIMLITGMKTHLR